MKKAIYLFIILGVLTSCINQRSENVKVVSAEEMQSLLELDDVQLVDVRTADEFEKGYIANAQNIDYFSPTFDEDLKNLDKTKPVVLYCKSGVRSSKCAEKMAGAGFVKIYDLEGGISEWRHKGFEIKTKS